MKILYVKGDVTCPICKPAIIVHICNNLGAFGAGVSGAISDNWKIVETEYRKWAASKVNFELGEAQFLAVEKDLYVGNMIGQHGIGIKNGNVPIRYDAVSKCLEKVRGFALSNNLSVHMPRIGCGLAGGKWPEVEKIIVKELINYNISVIVYDL